MDLVKAEARTHALHRSGLLDGAATLGLDKLAGLARYVAGAKYAAIHLLDGTSQHRVGESGGLQLGAGPVEASMCLPVVESELPLYTADATEEALFAGHPLTSGPAPVRLFAANPLRDATGVTIGTLCVFDDEALTLDDARLSLLADLALHVGEHLQLHSRVQQLGHAATHDVLTGLPNRVLLSERLARAMTRRARREGDPALALIDLDGFKAVNDSLGHQAGDALLIEVSNRLSEAVREEDTVARLGGDEFVVLYEQLPADRSDEVADALRVRLGQALVQPVTVADKQIAVGASVGFVRSVKDELGYELLGRADKAMYEQKQKRSA